MNPDLSSDTVPVPMHCITLQCGAVLMDHRPGSHVHVRASDSDWRVREQLSELVLFLPSPSFVQHQRLYHGRM